MNAATRQATDAHIDAVFDVFSTRMAHDHAIAQLRNAKLRGETCLYELARVRTSKTALLQSQHALETARVKALVALRLNSKTV